MLYHPSFCDLHDFAVAYLHASSSFCRNKDMNKNEQHWRLGWCIFPFLSWTMVADVTPHVTATRRLKNQRDKMKFLDNRVRFLFKKIHHLQGRDPAKIPTVLKNLFSFLPKISPHGCRRIAFCPARYFLSHPVYDTPLAFSVLQKIRESIKTELVWSCATNGGF